MALDLEFLDHVCDQMGDAGEIRSRQMFGGAVIYCDDKVVALVVDDGLFVKATPGGRTYIGGEPMEAPPYQGAKPHFLIEGGIDDREWLAGLIAVTARELSAPKPRKPRKPKKPRQPKPR
jgi:TfoX/Sxy family transcriptional regulator of competence genes